MELPRSLACLGSVSQVDEVIRKTRRYLSDLYAHRNSLVPINARLPREILCEIFLHLAAECRTSMRHSYGWIKKINICRHWRNTSLQHPRLWAYIELRFTSEWLNVLLARSKQAPLTIAGPLHFYSSEVPRSWGEIFPHLHRIRYLRIHVLAAQWETFLAGLKNAPLLETLHLSGEHSYPAPNATLSLPRLRHLELHDIMPHGIAQSTLVRLRLTQIAPAQPVAYWILLLQGLPALQDLEIKGGFRSQRVASQIYSGRAQLPSLRNLTLQESSDGMLSAEFLQHIDCPASVVMAFRGEAEVDDQARYNHIHRVISAKAYVNAHPFLSCCMNDGTVSWEPKASYRLWPTRETMESMAYAPEHLSSLPRVTVGWSGSCLRRASHSFLQSFPLSHLRTLCFDSSAIVPDNETWNHCLRFTELRELRVRHRAAVESLVRALCDSGTPRQTPCFPLLEGLTISHIKWCSYHPDDPSKQSTRPDLLPDIDRMLVWRKSQGLPLKRLDIDVGGNLEPGRMSRFAKDAEEQELLEVFEWCVYDSMTSDCSTCDSEEDSDDSEDSDGDSEY